MNYLIIFFTLFILNTPSETKDLKLTITNIQHMEGNLVIGVYNSGGRFLEAGQAFRTISVDVNNGTEVVVVENLPLGTYAVSMYHDKNSNGKCDRNFLGIPKEPYGFSNNFRPKFSAPTFNDCKFILSSDQDMEISLVH